MFELSEFIVLNLARATIGLSLAAVIGCGLLRLFRVQSPRLQRVVWFCVLAQGWVFWQISLPLISSSANAEIVAPFSQDDKAALNNSTGTHSETTDLEIFAARDRKTSTSQFANSLESADGFSETLLTQSSLNLFLLCWTSGIVILCLRLAWNYRQFLHYVDDAEPAETDWYTEWEQFVKQQGVQANIPLLVHDTGPLLCRVPGGYRFLVPREFWNDLDKLQRRAIMQHELAHYRRRDLWKSLTMRLLMLPHWFNPFTWLTVRRFDECAELACDDAVREDGEGDSLSYAQTLLTLLRRDQFANTFCAGAGGHCLATRIKRLVTPSIKEDALMKRISLLAVVVCCSLLGLFRIVEAEDLDPVQAPTPERSEANKEIASDAVAGNIQYKIDVAYINMPYLFKKSLEFTRKNANQQRELQHARSELQKTKEQYIKFLKEPISPKMAEKLQTELLQLEEDLIIQQEKMEAALYGDVFDNIQAEVAKYAEEKGIRVVRRFNVSDKNDAQKDSAARRRRVIQRINADVIYPANLIHQADERVDITQDILERLNKKSLAGDSPAKPTE